MFGKGFRPLESLVLDNTQYDCEIISAVEKKYPQTQNVYVEVTVRIPGKEGYSPNIIKIDDRPVLGTLKANGKTVEQADLDKWDRRQTKFMKAFHLPAFPNIVENPQSWVHAKGRVSCNWQYDPKEPDGKSKSFKQLTPVVVEESASALSFINGGQNAEPQQTNFYM